MSVIYASTAPKSCQVGWLTSRLTGDTLRVGCGSWVCAECGPRRRRQWMRERADISQSYATMKFVTLTLPAGVAWGGYRQMQLGWRRLWQWLRRTYGLTAYIWVTELTSRGVVHRHAVLDAKYVPQRALSQACERFGLGRVVDIRAVKDKRRLSNYVTKYLTKSSAGAAHPRYARRVQSSVHPVREVSDEWLYQRKWQFCGRDLRWLCIQCARRPCADGEGTLCWSCDQAGQRRQAEMTFAPAASLDCPNEKVHQWRQEVCHDFQKLGP